MYRGGVDLEENENENLNNESKKIDENVKEIIKNCSKSAKLTDTEVKKILEEVNKSFDFEKMLNDIKQKYPLQNDKYVIFTNGKEQLYYENGEFFVISATNSKGEKKKIKRKEALDLYNEYYIVNVLNPLLKRKESRKEVRDSVIVNEDVKEVEKIEKVEKTEKIAEVKEEKNIEGKEIKKPEKVKQVNEEPTNQIQDSQKNINTDYQTKDVEERLKILKEKEEKLKEKRKTRENKTR